MNRRLNLLINLLSSRQMFQVDNLQDNPQRNLHPSLLGSPRLCRQDNLLVNLRVNRRHGLLLVRQGSLQNYHQINPLLSPL